MRQPFTVSQAKARGFTEAALKWQVKQGCIQRVRRGVYVEGVEPPTDLERAMAEVVAVSGIAFGTLAGVLYGFDGVWLEPPFVSAPITVRTNRADLPRRFYYTADVIDFAGVRCTSPEQTLIELAACISDDRWEQALESALRNKLVKLDSLAGRVEELGASRVPGTARIRRVLDLRPIGARPTGSILETMMVQLIRKYTELPPPERQVSVRPNNPDGPFVDLAWPSAGLFLELDGQQHKDQPVYDARRETFVVATKGWLPGRFTWHEVTRVPIPTARRVKALHAQALLRFRSPIAAVK